MKSRLFHWVDERFPLLSTWEKYAQNYHVPKNLNVLYCFGVLACVALCMQWITGLWLAMFYTPTSNSAFASLQHIMRDVPWGWLLRYMHSTGASAVWIVLYVHIFRGLLYGSYQKPRELVWLLGCFLFFLMIMESFMGYVLPWGQMSYWSAQVMTSLFGTLPYVGDTLMTWVRGGDVVSGITLHRFFALHVIGIPLFIFILIYLHIVALHKVGSNNPQGIDVYKMLDAQGLPLDGEPFYPKYVRKDLRAVLIFLWLFFAAVFFFPEGAGYFLEPTNFAEHQKFVTPEQMAPLWYMTPFYAMLRVMPHPLAGFFILCSSLLMFCFLPWLDHSMVRAMRYKGWGSRVALSVWFMSFILLGYLGLQPMTPVNHALSWMGTVFYFAYFLLMPLYTRYERSQTLPLRVSL